MTHELPSSAARTLVFLRAGEHGVFVSRAFAINDILTNPPLCANSIRQ